MATRALVLVLLVLLAAWPTPGEAQPERLPLVPGEVLNARLHNFSRPGAGTPEDQRVVLLEDYTATWCPPCADADAALTRLLDEYSPSYRAEPPANASPPRVALLQVHPWPDRGYNANDADPFGLPEASDRMQAKYEAFWFPTLVVDGTVAQFSQLGNVTRVEGAADRNYAQYRARVEQRLAVPPAARLEIQEAELGAEARVTFYVEPHERVGDRTLLAYVALVEDHVRFLGSNGVADHRFTVRALLAPERWEGPAPRLVTRTFDLEAFGQDWNRSRLAAVVWVEAEKPVAAAAADAMPLFLWAVGSAAFLGLLLALPALRERATKNRAAARQRGTEAPK